jgi:hypothetical protein
MKTLRSAAGFLFLGRNTANLAMRFEFHLWALVGLLLLTATGGGMRSVARLLAARDKPVSDGLMSVIQIGNASMIAAYVLGGYLLITMTALVLMGVVLKGENEEEPSADA